MELCGNRMTASTTEYVWQGVGTNQSDDSISGQLLQLDLATQSF
jgi:hypothetical protein